MKRPRRHEIGEVQSFRVDRYGVYREGRLEEDQGFKGLAPKAEWMPGRKRS